MLSGGVLPPHGSLGAITLNGIAVLGPAFTLGGGRVAAHEIMLGIPAVRNLIREDKVAQLYSVIQTGMTHGMQTMDQSLKQLVNRGVVASLDAKAKAVDPNTI